MNEVIEKLGGYAVVPVVAIEDARDAAPLADALVEGGLAVAEITFRTDAAEDAIRALANRGDMLVGAGTVLTVEQARLAADAGARFIVSPGVNPPVVEHCINVELPITPGISSPTDIDLAMSFGLTALKFFPAEAFGGLKTLKAIAAPYRMCRFIPTGGISADNLADYLAFDPVLACGGSWMVKPQLIAEKRFDRIAELTREAVAIAERATSP